jgi:5-methylcytosine-specific restriction endonuclease McrA
MCKRLASPILVLDKTFAVSHITSTREAINSVCLGRAKVIDHNYSMYNFEEWCEQESKFGYINSVNFKVPVPKVIYMYKRKNKGSKRKIRYSRQKVFERDNYTCQYCGFLGNKKTLTLEHVIPKSKSGQNTYENTVASCLKCNNKKGSKSLKEMGWNLSKKPKMPSLREFIKSSYKEDYEDYWHFFLKF